MVLAELNKVFTKLNKKFGDDIIVKGEDIRDGLIGRMTSGSLALDAILGGGWPTNQWHEIVGEASNGKTAIALKTIAANQKLNPEFTVVWVAAEQWVPEYAEMCGVNMNNFILINTNIMEEAYESIIQLVKTKHLDCIVIDSLPALVPTAENEKEMDEFTVGRGASMTNKFFRKVGIASKRSMINYERPFIGLMINQWRDKVGGYGDSRTTPGGRGKDYAYFTRIDVSRADWIKVGSSKDPNRVGQTIKVRTIKNKSAPPSQIAYIDFYFKNGGSVPRGEYDFAKECVALGMLNDVITRSGAYYSYAGRKWQGGDAVLASIKEEIDLREQLEKEVLDVIKAGSKLVALEEDDDSDDYSNDDDNKYEE